MQDHQKGSSFQAFWKECGVNLLIGLAITVVICAVVGIRGLLMPLPLWLALGLVCWLVRLWLVYRRWLQDGGADQAQEGRKQP